MGALDIVKDIVRLVRTAGLSNEVIDLLEKKIASLTEEMASLRTEVARLKTENAELQTQIKDAQPVGFVENDGLLWKRNATGFEPRPYCPLCPNHPVMMAFPRDSNEMWACPQDHTFAYDSKPPSA